MTLCLILNTLHLIPAFAQNMSINANGAPPDSSAMLDVSSTSSGFLMPRMTTTQMNAITNPASGLQVYNTDSSAFYFYNGTVWLPSGISSGGGEGSSTEMQYIKHRGSSYTETADRFKATDITTSGDSIIQIDNSGSQTVFRVLQPAVVWISTTVNNSVSGYFASVIQHNQANFIGTQQEQGSHAGVSTSFLVNVGDSIKIGISGGTGTGSWYLDFVAMTPGSGSSAGSSSQNDTVGLQHVLDKGNNAAGDSLLNVGTLTIGTDTPGIVAGSERYLTLSTGTNSGVASLELHGRASGASAPLAKVDFINYATSSANFNTARIEATTSPSSTQEGALHFYTRSNGDGFAKRMSIMQTGRVGIGTNAPSYMLHISKASTATAMIESLDTTTATLRFKNSVRTFAQYVTANGGLIFKDETTDAVRFMIDSLGNVGIHTNTPDYPLHVLGTGENAEMMLETTASNDASIFFSSPSITWNVISTPGTGNFRVRNETAGADRLVISSGGNVGIGTTNPASRLHVHNPSGTQSVIRLTHTATASNGLWLTSDNAQAYLINYDNTPIKFATNGADRMIIGNTGNVGIGTSAPSSKLTVTGGDIEVTSSGNILLSSGEVNRTQTGSFNLVPIAMGSISAAGAVLTGTGNFSVAKTATGEYTITITSETFTTSGYIVNATVAGSAAVAYVSSNSGNLIVNTATSLITLTAVDRAFTFMVYKP